MRLDFEIEAELDSLLHERDILRFDRRLDVVAERIEHLHLMVFYDKLDPRRKLHVVTDLLTDLLEEQARCCWDDRWDFGGEDRNPEWDRFAEYDR
jgi:hypothetical protein